MRTFILSSILLGASCIAAPSVRGLDPLESVVAAAIPEVGPIVPDVTGALPSGVAARRDGGFKVPAARRRAVTRATGDVDPEVYFGQLQYTIQKYKHSFKLPFSVSDVAKKVKRAKANEPLQAQVEGGVEEDYYGTITVGATSPQEFVTDFDTGSADIFVPGPNCQSAQGCTGTTKYDQGGVDEHNTTSVTYGSGQISGENFFDDVIVAGLRAKHQNVISLNQAQGFSDSTPDSLMGMAFSTIANSKQPTYFENLIAQKVVSTPEFSFYLGRAADGTTNASELTLGGRDRKKFKGPVTKVPVTDVGYWQVALDKVVVNGNTGVLDFTPGQAAIDTGTTIVLAPSLAAADIYASIPGSIPLLPDGVDEPEMYAYPCSAKTNVAIVFAGRSFAIDPRDFNLGTLTSDFAQFMGQSKLINPLSSGTYCLSAIAGFDIDPLENLYVVGDTFLKNWYSIFNYVNANGKPSVSFAKSV